MSLGDLEVWQLALVGALGAIQLVLLIAGLVSVLRTPAERLTAPKPVWILICFVQIVGPIIYFAMGRKPAPATPPAPTTSSGDVIARVIGELYGARS